MIRNMTFRQLQNGFTVKYHVETVSKEDALPSTAGAGFTREFYVKDKAELIEAVRALLIQYVG